MLTTSCDDIILNLCEIFSIICDICGEIFLGFYVLLSNNLKYIKLKNIEAFGDAKLNFHSFSFNYF